jgi:hypothetical protein
MYKGAGKGLCRELTQCLFVLRGLPVLGSFFRKHGPSSNLSLRCHWESPPEKQKVVMLRVRLRKTAALHAVGAVVSE